MVQVAAAVAAPNYPQRCVQQLDCTATAFKSTDHTTTANNTNLKLPTMSTSRMQASVSPRVISSCPMPTSTILPPSAHAFSATCRRRDNEQVACEQGGEAPMHRRQPQKKVQRCTHVCRLWKRPHTASTAAQLHC